MSGKTGALTSEAGTPAVADPGYEVVAHAHREGIPVKPLPGNNAIILGLMSSGLNGNQFTYHGYFPIQPSELKKKLNALHPAIRNGYRSEERRVGKESGARGAQGRWSRKKWYE